MTQFLREIPLADRQAETRILLFWSMGVTIMQNNTLLRQAWIYMGGF